MANDPSADAPKPLSAIFEYPILIRENHLDTFGHMNNAVYLEIFEEARWDLITARGFGLAEVMKTGHGPTILDIHVRFQREVRNREQAVVKTFIIGVGKKTSTLRQILVNGKGEDACIADFVFGLFDVHQRKLIEPTDAWKRAIGLDP